jgi:hypothetical protein
MPLRLQALSEPMEMLAEGTGGVFFHNNNDLNAGFRETGGLPEVTYRLSFRPEDATDGAYHKLKLSVIHTKNYSVQARPGYFAPTDKTPESLQARIDREIVAEDTKSELPVGMAIRQVEATLAVTLHVDISKLRFEKKGDREAQRIMFAVALMDAQGRIVIAKEGEMDLALTEGNYKGLLGSGVKAIIHLQAPAGSYKLRQVTEEAIEGKIACSTQVVEVK